MALLSRRQGLARLLALRGFDVEALLGETTAQVLRATESNTLSFDVAHGQSDAVCYVHWSTKQQNMKQADFVKLYEEYAPRIRPQDSLLIVTAVPPTQPITKLVQNAWNDNRHTVTIFTYEDLDATPWLHERWIPARLLSDEQAAAVFARFGSADKFPEVSFNDKAVKVCGGRPGQVIEYTRWSATSGSTLYYRVITN